MLVRLLQVAPPDRPKVVLLFLYLLLAVGGAVVVGRSVGRALFLSALPPEAVPLKLAVSAVAVVGATVVYAAAGQRLPLGRLVVASQVVMGGGVLALWLLLRTPLGGTLPVLTGLFGWVEIVASLITTQFWVLTGQLFDPRSARRTFGLIAAGGPLANVAAGALLAGVAERLPTADLLLVTAAAAGLCAAATAGLVRGHPEALGAAREEPARPRAAPPPGGPTAREPDRASLLRTLRLTAGSPLLGAIAGILLLGTAVTNVVDYQLDLALQARYGGDERAMASFLGAYNLWVGAAAFVVQVGLIALVLERFGLRAALATLPIGFALGAAAVVASGGALLAVAAARANDLLFRFTLNDAGLNMLYLPIPAAARRRAKEALDGVVKPVTVVLLAALFALARAAGWRDLVVWSLPVLLLAALWLWLVARAGAAYHVALIESLRRRRLTFDALRLDAADPATRRALLGALHGQDDALALAALKTLAEAPGHDWDGAVARLLASPSPELRIAAAQHLGRSGQAAFGPAVARLLEAPEPVVRAAGVAALAALGGEDARLGLALRDDALEVRRAAIVALVRRGGAVPGAHAALRGMLASADPAERAAAAGALGEIARPGWEPELAGLLEDPRVEVRRAAVRAVASVGATDLAGPVIARLGDPALATTAATALVHLGARPTHGPGAPMLDLLAGRLADATADPAIRRAVPRVLARIGGRDAVPALLRHAADHDAGVRGALYAAVAELGPLDDAARAALSERVAPELAEAYALRALWVDLGAAGRGDLLGEAIASRLDEAVGRVFTLLGGVFPGAGMAEAWRGVHSDDARKRANALEVVDDALGRAWRVELMPLLEAPPERVAELARERFGVAPRSPAERLAELAAGPDRWLRVCALERIGRLGLAALGGAVESAIVESDQLVQETALVAGQAFLPPERVATLLGEAVARP